MYAPFVRFGPDRPAMWVPIVCCPQSVRWPGKPAGALTCLEEFVDELELGSGISVFVTLQYVLQLQYCLPRHIDIKGGCRRVHAEEPYPAVGFPIVEAFRSPVVTPTTIVLLP